jgi:hypothetical protein
MTFPKTLLGCVAILVTSWPAFAAEEPAQVADLYRRLFQERMQNIERLRHYHTQGVFPRNYDFPTSAPYFVDAHGTHCAMAHLVKESGDVGLVRKVVAFNNNIYIKEVKDGPFFEWMLWSGLTHEECERIQPVYRPQPPFYPGYPPQPPQYPYPVIPPGFPVYPPQPPQYPVLQPGYPAYPPQPQLPFQLQDPDDQRIKQYLAGVEAELTANTFQSLSKAMGVLRARNKLTFLNKSYAVVAPPVEKTERAAITLKNQSKSRQIEVMLTFFDSKGEIAKQAIPKFQAASNHHTVMMAVGQELQVPYRCANTWVVVEWTAGLGLNITVPFETVADVKMPAK